VTRRWDDLNARARGLRTHLLPRRDLERLAQAPDLPSLADGLRAAGFPVTDADRFSPAALELAVRRRAGARLAILRRWCGPRAAAAAVLYDDEDRLNLRSILRGAAAGAPPELRLAGTVPTPALPERALVELARQPTPRAVAALLTAWRHPCGPPLTAALGAGQADLLRLELALNRHFTERAMREARGGPVADFVREIVDIENVFAALVLADQPADVTPKDAFLAGGRLVGIGDFEEAVASGSASAAAARLARACGMSALGRVLGRPGADPAAFEAAVLRARIADQRSAARRDPLGPAPLLGFVLGLRAETADLRRLIWGLALAAPRAQLAAELATVA
jgi:vacuolar-type H+-ATPase subunit C/Vma6